MKVLAAILVALVITMVTVPAYAVIIELKSENTSYKKGDQIVFTGKTDSSHANTLVVIRVANSNNEGVMVRMAYSDGDGNFKTNPINTSDEETAAKFTKGIYNATAFYGNEPQPQKIWKFTLFDYSPDGSPVVPSAADVMAQKSQPQTQQPTTQQPTTQQPTTQQPTTQQPTTQQPEEPKCGTGTVLKDGVCVVAEPEPEPEAETGYKQTHIPGFPDPTKDPQYYIDRYNNEPAYKEWFDRNFPDDTIYEILGVPGPKKTHIPGFPDPTKDPQYYIDRYNNEPAYKEWFDRNFPDDTIYEIVGVAEPTEQEPPSACGPGTHLENGICILDESTGGLLGGGCLIATAAYGTELAPQVQQLRELRDGTVAKTGSGVAFLGAFNSIYYSFSPTIADWERENPAFKETVKITLAPMLSTLSILSNADIDSESELLGYGLGVVLLNIGMYFMAPAFAIIHLQKLVRSKT